MKTKKLALKIKKTVDISGTKTQYEEGWFGKFNTHKA